MAVGESPVVMTMLMVVVLLERYCGGGKAHGLDGAEAVRVEAVRAPSLRRRKRASDDAADSAAFSALWITSLKA